MNPVLQTKQLSKSLNMTMVYNLPISIFMKEKYARLSDEMAQVNRRYLN